MKRLLSVLLAVCLISVTVWAQRSSAELAVSGWHPLSAGGSAAAADSARRSAAYAKFKEVLSSDFTMGERAFVLGRGEYVYVYFPVKHQGQETGSIYMSVLDKETLTVQETLGWTIEKTADGHHAKVSRNGDDFLDAVIDADGTILNGWRMENGVRADLTGKNFTAEGEASRLEFLTDLKASQTEGSDAGVSDINCLNECLSNNGVPLYLISLIGIICAIACLGTAGLACYICLGGVLGGYLGIGGSCLENCGYLW